MPPQDANPTPSFGGFGLNWRMILARRDAFREAFHGWQIDKVAGMSTHDVSRLRWTPKFGQVAKRESRS